MPINPIVSAALCLLLCMNLVSVYGYKILVFSPTIQKSHMISNGRVADALAKDGHNVVGQRGGTYIDSRFRFQTLLEVEYDVRPDAIVSARYAHRLQVFGPFVKKEAEDDKFKVVVESAFTERSFFYRLLFAYGFVTMFQKHLTSGCEGRLLGTIFPKVRFLSFHSTQGYHRTAKIREIRRHHRRTAESVRRRLQQVARHQDARVALKVGS